VKLSIAALTVVFAVALASPALADDQSLANTYGYSHSPELNAAVDDYVKAARRVAQSDFRDHKAIRRAIAADKRIVGLVTAVLGELNADQPSSEPGGRAKTWSLRSYGWWRAAARLDGRALRAALAGRFRKGYRLAKRSSRAFKRSEQASKRAEAAFREAGVEPQPPDSQAQRAAVRARLAPG
jgi:hypothetical protein